MFGEGMHSTRNGHNIPNKAKYTQDNKQKTYHEFTRIHVCPYTCKINNKKTHIPQIYHSKVGTQNTPITTRLPPNPRSQGVHPDHEIMSAMSKIDAYPKKVVIPKSPNLPQISQNHENGQNDKYHQISTLPNMYPK